MLAEKTVPGSARYGSSDIAYCSNVHSGEDLSSMIDNLHRFVERVMEQRNLSHLTSGLWISAAAAAELQDESAMAVFSQHLKDTGVQLTSLNGFPYGGFHRNQLKAGVYLPDWSQPARLEYTRQLAEILAANLPEGVDSGVISSVPLGYKQSWNHEKQAKAVAHLTDLTAYLHELEQKTGKHILLCLEMEPDCVLESTDELIEFFHSVVSPSIPGSRYLGCCYDVCHQAVMHEDIYSSLQRITSAGITIGKIQLSSALQVKFDSQVQDTELVAILKQLCEPRYLHQVKILDEQGSLSSEADLPLVLNGMNARQQSWRIHFHTPIYFHHLVHSGLQTTAAELFRVFEFLAHNPALTPCLEVETYSWQVLPESVRPDTDKALIAGITRELEWVEHQLEKYGLLQATVTMNQKGNN
ncbi:MAG: metabolite traffic protein EboE [Endozoicomonas sp.]